MPQSEVPWTEFQPASITIDYNDPKTQQDIQKACDVFGCTPEQAKAQFEEAKKDTIYLNSRYQVNVRQNQVPESLIGMQPRIIHLSIKRLDKGTFIPWRDKQRIKNEILGPEIEAVELFPAESRLVDTANQYHLWCIAEPGYKFPFGFTERFVTEQTLGNAQQAPFEP